MYNKIITNIILLTLLSYFGFGQDCNVQIKGKIIDEATQAPLSFVNVIIQELGKGTTTDDEGVFVFDRICIGHYNLIVSHIGCEPKEMHIHVDGDTTYNISLIHNSISLENVVIEGKSTFVDQPSKSVGKQAIEDNSDRDLSGLLENESGVRTLKNGGGISKPVVHGLFGNRLLILNNGVIQSGQQWGNDHSPEIDPLTANRVTVIKGTNALEYGGGNLGSIILVEPKMIGRDPHLHGRVNYSYETNGRGNNANIQLQKYTPFIGWRINGTLRNSGDKHSPDYYLNNTGSKEANFALQLEKSWYDKLFIDLYGSTFNTELGVLRGSHIGNLTDLEGALASDIPFFTEDEFSNDIDAPKQEVSHQLLKLNTKYFFNDESHLHLILAFQQNNRKEFDIRRGGRTEIPAMSLNQYTYTFDLKYITELRNKWKWKIGNQTILTDNTNNPETGILPLIPDYFSFKSGIFSTLKKSWGRIDYNIGARYDYELQNVATISNSIPREIIRYQNNFNNISATSGFGYEISKIQTIGVNTGFTVRNPAINELYSGGLHQGVSGIEEGDINLNAEKAWKTTVEYTARLGSKFSFGSLLYYQKFNNYIFLNPQDDFRLTIRGAFPVFKYEQTDAEIYGMDLSLQFSSGQSVFGQIKYSFIRGNDTSSDIPLVNIPSSNLFGNLTYRKNNPIKLAGIKIENFEFELNNSYVFRQNNLLTNQDFVIPPDAYYLIGLKMSANIIKSKYKIRWFVKVDNILDTTYRDYLNRQRYFADDLGRSTTLGINFSF